MRYVLSPNVVSPEYRLRRPTAKPAGQPIRPRRIPTSRRPGRRDRKGPRFSAASAARCLNLSRSNDLHRQRKTRLLRRASAVLRRELVSTCRSYRFWSSFRGDRSIPVYPSICLRRCSWAILMAESYRPHRAYDSPNHFCACPELSGPALCRHDQTNLASISLLPAPSFHAKLTRVRVPSMVNPAGRYAWRPSASTALSSGPGARSVNSNPNSQKRRP
jgi:hypothetical protein